MPERGRRDAEAHETATAPSAERSGPSRDALNTHGAAYVQRLISPLPNDDHEQEPVPGKAFIQGKGDADAVDPNDVAQGRLNDCYFLAGMAALARADPGAIRRLIHDNGDNTYDVTLYVRSGVDWRTGAVGVHKHPVTVRVDNTFPVTPWDKKDPLAYAQPGDRQGGQAELWPMLLEKAYATICGSYHSFEPSLHDSYEHDPTELGKAARAFDVLTPGKVQTVTPRPGHEREEAEQIAHALREHRPVMATVDSVLLPWTKEAIERAHAHERHCYAVMSVDPQRMTISLLNPWGEQHLPNLPMTTFVQIFHYYAIGEPA
jgi:hypothetical protein